MIFQIAQKVRDTSPVIGTLALLEFRFDLDIYQNFLLFFTATTILTTKRWQRHSKH